MGNLRYLQSEGEALVTEGLCWHSGDLLPTAPPWPITSEASDIFKKVTDRT